MKENGLKQRLVGAMVLVALGVIFIPMLLSGGGQSGLTLLRSNVPPDPVGSPDNAPIPLPDLPAGPAPMPPRELPLAVEAPPPAPSAPQPAASAPPPAASAPQPAPAAPEPAPPAAAAGGEGAPQTPAKAWVVQLASFEREANARALRDRLLAMHHHAFVEPVQTGEGTVYRVRVGPEVRREEAERLKESLKRETRLNGLVVAHP